MPIFGRRPALWFENGAPGARHEKFAGTADVAGARVGIMGSVLSREGLGFVCSRRIEQSIVPVTFTIRSRAIPTRVRIDAHTPHELADRTVHRYFCTFVAIASDDWDAVVRYVENVPEPVAHSKPVVVDDDFRSLPQTVQDLIVRQLVAMRRIAAPVAGVAPLLRMKAGSVSDLGGGSASRDVVIQSRVAGDDTPRTYTTRFRVFSPENRIELLGPDSMTAKRT